MLQDITKSVKYKKSYNYCIQIRVICPAIPTILTNMYRIPTRIYITGGGEILSQEGTTQGTA